MLVRKRNQFISEQRKQQLQAAKERYDKFQSERREKVRQELARRKQRKIEARLAAKESRKEFYQDTKQKLRNFDDQAYLKSIGMTPNYPKRNKVRDKMLTKSSYWSDFSYG